MAPDSAGAFGVGHGWNLERLARHLWYQGYVQTYLERDLQDLSAIDNLVDFQRLMRATCLRLGTMANMTELSRDTGVPRQSVQRYLNLLETSCQLMRVEPYSVNRTKRLIKTPKMYWSDTGLALFLSGDAAPGGAHLENLVLHDLVAWRDSHVPRPNVLYWRTSAGHEVDFVIEHQDQLLPMEASSCTPALRSSGSPRTFSPCRGGGSCRGSVERLALQDRRGWTDHRTLIMSSARLRA